MRFALEIVKSATITKASKDFQTISKLTKNKKTGCRKIVNYKISN
jgi:hypothetical protein